jgi:hypothetical protein
MWLYFFIKKKIDPISSEENNVTENQKPIKGETPNESPKSHNYDEIFKGISILIQ